MKSLSLGMLVCLAGLVAYGCTSQKLPTDPEPGDDDTSSSSSGDVSSSSSGEPSSSSSGDVTSSSSSGDVTSSSSSSGSTVPEDGGTDGQTPDTCTVITATQWVVSELCGAGGNQPCPSTFESQLEPAVKVHLEW